jgi:oligopeptide transport system ATP-binding protein
VSSTDPLVERARTPPILSGDPPSPRSPPSGCRFHTRCPIAEARCSTDEPLLRAIPGAGQAACHLAG